MRGGTDRNRKPSSNKAPAAEEQQAEETVEAEEVPEHQRMQNQLGNQAMAAMVSARSSTNAGGAAVESSFATQQEQEEDVVYGGIDDPDDGPPTILDLTQSWNPRLKKSKDRPKFVESMPDPELPDEDDAFLNQVRSTPWAGMLPWTEEPDRLLQPPSITMARSVRPWLNAVQFWCGGRPLDRAWLHLLRFDAALQDPHGRLLLSRVRVGAMATLCLAASPVARASVPNAMFVDFCLDVAGQQHAADDLAFAATQDMKTVPVTAKLMAPFIERTPHRVELTKPTREQLATLHAHLAPLFQFNDPRELIPRLDVTPRPPPEDDDPLKLRAVLEEHTQAPADEGAARAQRALTAARGFGAGLAWMRIHNAGACVAIAQAATMWSAGVPAANLYEAAALLDRATESSLKLLREVAGAAQQRTVPPRGLRIGLTRIAKGMTSAQRGMLHHLCGIILGLLPEPPQLEELVPVAEDALSERADDNTPTSMVDWLARIPHSADRHAATIALDLADGARASTHADALLFLREGALSVEDSRRAAALGVLAAAGLLAAKRYDEARALAHSQATLAWSRRNGLLLADAGLLELEAMHGLELSPAAIQATRVEYGQRIWALGAEAALSLMARWRPPEEEDENAPPADSDTPAGDVEDDSAAP